VLNVPFCIIDATALTEAGYVGEDVETILARLLQAADYDLARAATGVVYIDEIDKIARKSGPRPSGARDVSGEGVQTALLKIVEGAVVNLPVRAHPLGERVQLDTSGVLFICGGSFDGLADIVARRTSTQDGIGFTAGRARSGEWPSGDDWQTGITPEDLVHFGLIPELVGRLPVIVALRPLDHETLVRVLVEPKNALLRQYQELLELDGVELRFAEEALAAVADEALRRGMGARGLRAIIESVLLDLMYVVPSRPDIRRVIVDEETVRRRTRPPIYDGDSRPLAWNDEPQ
jgi:ATP-dependent Clp protease ATP-binding subunit ClpX